MRHDTRRNRVNCKQNRYIFIGFIRSTSFIHHTTTDKNNLLTAHFAKIVPVYTQRRNNDVSPIRRLRKMCLYICALNFKERFCTPIDCGIFMWIFHVVHTILAFLFYEVNLICWFDVKKTFFRIKITQGFVFSIYDLNWGLLVCGGLKLFRLNWVIWHGM